MNKGLLSIIIPVYNVKDYIEKCLDSVLNQDYKNFEVIVIDDGSTDGGDKICDLYSNNDKITVIHTENRGLAAARNLGIKHAKGEYIAFLDSDDCIDKKIYDLLINKMIEDNSEISFCEFYETYPNGNKIEYREECIDILCKEVQNQYPLFEMYPWKKTEYIKKSKSMLKCVWRSVFKKEIIDKYNIKFDTRARWGEDALFMTEYLGYCKKGSFVKQPLYYYSVREGSLVNQYKKDFLKVRKYLFEKESKLIEKNTFHNKKEKQYLLNELRLINCLALVLNEIRDHEKAYQRLKDLSEDEFFKSLLPWSCVRQSMACNRPIKHLFFSLLVKMQAWRFIILVYRK